MDDQTPDDHNPNTKPTPINEAPLTFNSEDLFQGRKEILVRHGEEVYKMRITRNGKLILNK